MRSRKFLAKLVEVYQTLFSGILATLFGKGCRFEPTCSEYSRQAILKKGVFRGTIMSLRRISRCHPLGGSGYDPVK